MAVVVTFENGKTKVHSDADSIDMLDGHLIVYSGQVVTAIHKAWAFAVAGPQEGDG